MMIIKLKSNELSRYRLRRVKLRRNNIYIMYYTLDACEFNPRCESGRLYMAAITIFNINVVYLYCMIPAFVSFH